MWSRKSSQVSTIRRYSFRLAISRWSNAKATDQVTQTQNQLKKSGWAAWACHQGSDNTAEIQARPPMSRCDSNDASVPDQASVPTFSSWKYRFKTFRSQKQRFCFLIRHQTQIWVISQLFVYERDTTVRQKGCHNVQRSLLQEGKKKRNDWQPA